MNPIEHQTLGVLTYEKQLNWYTTEFAFDGDTVSIRLSLDECTDVDALVAFGASIAAALRQLAESAAEYAANEQLGLKNDTWLGEDESPVSRDEFIKRLQLESVVAYPDGTAEWFFDDGDLFWGNCVLLQMESDQTFSDVSLAG